MTKAYRSNLKPFFAFLSYCLIASTGNFQFGYSLVSLNVCEECIRSFLQRNSPISAAPLAAVDFRTHEASLENNKRLENELSREAEILKRFIDQRRAVSHSESGNASNLTAIKTWWMSLRAHKHQVEASCMNLKSYTLYL